MYKKKMKKGLFLFISLISMISLFFLYYFNIIPHSYYFNSDFNILTYESLVDKDRDGVQDQLDVLNSAKAYVETKPKYKSQYYKNGYPDDQYGVCTDVVAFALKAAGYDLQELVYEDIKKESQAYGIEKIDKAIDFRRVVNLNVYFKRNHITLTTDLKEIDAWQGGDIVVFPSHIGIISDKRNKKGIPFLIHHSNPYQFRYEEDVLARYTILGHYRIS